MMGEDTYDADSIENRDGLVMGGKHKIAHPLLPPQRTERAPS